jgi:hypothetical protein
MNVLKQEDEGWENQIMDDAGIESEGRWLVVGVGLFFLLAVCFMAHGYFRNSNMLQVAVSGMMATISALLLVGVDLSKANSTVRSVFTLLRCPAQFLARSVCF